MSIYEMATRTTKPQVSTLTAVALCVLTAGLTFAVHFMVVQLRKDTAVMSEGLKLLELGRSLVISKQFYKSLMVIGTSLVVLEWSVKKILLCGLAWMRGVWATIQGRFLKSWKTVARGALVVSTIYCFQGEIIGALIEKKALMIALLGVAAFALRGARTRVVSVKDAPVKGRVQKCVGLLKYADAMQLLHERKGADLHKALTTWDEVVWIEDPQVFGAQVTEGETKRSRKRTLSVPAEHRERSEARLEKELETILAKEREVPKRKPAKRPKVGKVECPHCGEMEPPHHRCWVIEKKVRCYRCKGFNHIALRCRNNASGVGMYVGIAPEMRPEELRKEYANLKKLIDECERVCKEKGVATADVDRDLEVKKPREASRGRRPTSRSRDPPRVQQAAHNSHGKRGAQYFREPEVAPEKWTSTTSGHLRSRSD